jgi:hypothetical protein
MRQYREKCPSDFDVCAGERETRTQLAGSPNKPLAIIRIGYHKDTNIGCIEQEQDTVRPYLG